MVAVTISIAAPLEANSLFIASYLTDRDTVCRDMTTIFEDITAWTY